LWDVSETELKLATLFKAKSILKFGKRVVNWAALLDKHRHCRHTSYLPPLLKMKIFV